MTFLGESGESSIMVAGIEKGGKSVDFNNGDMLSLERIGEVIRPTLRQEFWYRLEGSKSFVHFGWDFYMYVGVPHTCPGGEARAIELGMYVEECESHPLSIDEAAAEEGGVGR
jgi:hypothetical protein